MLRLRLRDIKGTVVFDAAKPNQAPHGDPDDEVEKAADAGSSASSRASTPTRSTRQAGRSGRAVEAYIPLNGGADAHVIGVLEIYLPYAPIAHSFVASTAR